MKLYGYWRSSAAYRVRIALHLKNIEFESQSIHLIKEGGQQHQNDYVALNPSHLVPTLIDGDLVLNQSVAIIDYIEARYPQTPLYPSDIAAKAKVQALALDIACEIHPINNLRVQQYLVQQLGVNDKQKLAWVHHWMALGFISVEKQLATSASIYCFGDDITLADICLIPQVYNALRFGMEMKNYPLISAIYERCNLVDAFIKAAPENQSDAQ
ncbi:MAG: maleylacetoacetate isomerase [Gammaproteobacteria bacterium]|nr:MAG: maleylacetoacetate isomerase [Gammaproteobacteria bacterium]